MGAWKDRSGSLPIQRWNKWGICKGSCRSRQRKKTSESCLFKGRLMVQPEMWTAFIQHKQPTALQRPALQLSVNAAVYLFRVLEIPLWYSNTCVVCIASSLGVVLNERVEAVGHVWKLTGIERNRVLYCSSQPGASCCINFKYSHSWGGSVGT